MDSLANDGLSSQKVSREEDGVVDGGSLDANVEFGSLSLKLHRCDEKGDGDQHESRDREDEHPVVEIEVGREE